MYTTEKQMAIPSHDDLVEFISAYTSANRAQRIAENYVATVRQHILIGQTRARDEQSAENTFPISTHQLHKECGRYGKPQQYWFPLLHAHFPMFTIVTKGSNLRGEQTVARTQIPIDILIAGQDVGALFDQLYADVDMNDKTQYDLAPINVKNLENFVSKTTNANHLSTARQILLIAQATNGQLPMIVHESNFGRKYYRGLNLQSCAKVVREAALGPCWSVDIENAVVNWKYSTMNDDTQAKLTYTREYIQDKQRIRKQLALLIFGNTEDYSINTIKRIMTAVGFGARGETNCWYKTSTGAWTQGSISEILYSKELRTKLFTDPWMMSFMMEQEVMNRAIESSLLPVFQSKPKLKQMVLTASGKRISVQKMIALAYQRAERTIMEQIDEWANAKRILLVHDGAYYATRPDIASMQTVLRESLSEAKLDLVQIDPWKPQATPNYEHLEHIRTETILANGGVDPHTTGIHTEQLSSRKSLKNTHLEPNWEQEMERQYQAYEDAQHSYPDFMNDIINRSNIH